jgi:uncharacterized membrane protein YqaE (UPF0057 family)
MASINTPFISLTINDTLLIAISFFLPPLSIFLRQGFWNKDFLINVLLTLFWDRPGFIHVVYVIYTTSSLRQSDKKKESKILNSNKNQPITTQFTTPLKKDGLSLTVSIKRN